MRIGGWFIVQILLRLVYFQLVASTGNDGLDELLLHGVQKSM